jgi:hypothetical protein
MTQDNTVSTGNPSDELTDPVGAEDPHMVIRERKITVMFQPPEVSPREIEIVGEYWNSGAAIMNIMRRLQAPRCNAGKLPLTYIDIYSILYTLAREKKISQRMTNMDELTLNDFAGFFKIWKSGGSLRECCKGIVERPTTGCVSFAKLVFRSISDRWRKEQKHFAEVKPLNVANPLDHVMELAVRRKVDDKDALVVFLSDIPVSLLSQLRRLANGLKYDPAIKTGSDVFDKIINLPPPSQPLPYFPEHPAPNPFDIITKPPSAREIIENQDLAILDPTGAVRQAAKRQADDKKQEAAERKRLGFGRLPEKVLEPAQHAVSQEPEPDVSDEGDLETILSEGSRSGNLTLDNLNDDDPIEPEGQE